MATWCALDETVSGDAFTKAALHELGHSMGLNENVVNTNQPCGGQTAGASVMNGLCGANDFTNNMATNVTTCDNTAVNNVGAYRPACSNTTMINQCHYDGGTWDYANCRCAGAGGEQYCPEQQYHCADPIHEYWDPYQCRCVGPTPILVDFTGAGFYLTGASDGVDFDIDGDGSKERVSWTRAGSGNAWLALDRNDNGAIDNGKELFGNFTQQPPLPGAEKNGFLALAEYDKSDNGGNGDGVIDSNDSIFSSLRLWQDANHDGVSQSGELYPLAAQHVASISLDYKEVRRRDRYGNQFRYQSTVTGTDKRITRRLAYDVFLLTDQRTITFEPGKFWASIRTRRSRRGHSEMSRPRQLSFARSGF